jgi:hypothetical protein
VAGGRARTHLQRDFPLEDDAELVVHENHGGADVVVRGDGQDAAAALHRAHAAEHGGVDAEGGRAAPVHAQAPPQLGIPGTPQGAGGVKRG